MTTVKQSRLLAVLFTLALTAAAVVPGAAAQAPQSAFSREQHRWAVNWINGPLETLMAHGIIESIVRDESTFRVLAGDAWSRLSFSQAGEILSSLSRARQITGHAPAFTVEQSSTGTVLGRVARNSIALLVPGEGYLEYFPDTYISETAAY